jgi:hypothetical protein
MYLNVNILIDVVRNERIGETTSENSEKDQDQTTFKVTYLPI